MAPIIDMNVNYRLHPVLPYGKYMTQEAKEKSGKPLDVDALIARMDEANIAMTGIVGNVGALDVGKGNGFGRLLDDNTADLVQEAVSQHPDRLFGWVGINPLGGFSTLRYIEHAVNDFGFKGVHIFPHWFVLPIDDRRYYPIYAKAAELGVPVALQTGIGGSPSGGKVVGWTASVENILFDFPELTLFALRVGHPWERDFVTLARNYTNLVLAADNPVGGWATEFIDLLRGKRPGLPDMTEQCVWGTNGPVVDPKVALKQIDELGLDEAVKARLIGGNVARLLKLDVPEPATAGGRR